MAVRKITKILENQKPFYSAIVEFPFYMVTHFPTMSNSLSDACGRTLYQMSSVKRVLLELKMEVKVEITAAIIAAIIKPRRPAIQFIDYRFCIVASLPAFVYRAAEVQRQVLEEQYLNIPLCCHKPLRTPRPPHKPLRLTSPTKHVTYAANNQ